MLTSFAIKQFLEDVKADMNFEGVANLGYVIAYGADSFPRGLARRVSEGTYDRWLAFSWRREGLERLNSVRKGWVSLQGPEEGEKELRSYILARVSLTLTFYSNYAEVLEDVEERFYLDFTSARSYQFQLEDWTLSYFAEFQAPGTFDLVDLRSLGSLWSYQVQGYIGYPVVDPREKVAKVVENKIVGLYGQEGEELGGVEIGG